MTWHPTVQGQLWLGDLDAMPAGAFQFEADDTGLLFMCPCGQDHLCCLGFRGKTPPERPSWIWDGNRDHPTLLPSIRHLTGCKWHGFLTAGVWIPCSDSGMWGT